MRIAVDYTPALWQGAGIGRYTRELISAAAGLDGGIELRLFYAAGGLEPQSPYLAELRRLCAAHRHVRPAPIPLSPRRLTQLWQRLRLPLPVELFTGPVDVVHATDFALPPTRARAIVTIHDLSYQIYPELFVPSLARYLARAVPRALRRADLVLADSEATRRDLGRLLGVDLRRVEVVYPGVSPAFRPLPPAAREPVRQRLGLPDDFLLFVSTISPRKNLVRLLEAFAALIADRKPGIDNPSPYGGLDRLQLVIAGQRGWLYQEVFATIARLGLRDRVRVLDYVDDKDLPALYNLATASVYPSIYEGFGLPALEALACGSPLLTADNSSLPEIVAGDIGEGPAAVLVDAEDVASIARGLRQIYADGALRERLRALGPARSRRFTWDGAARRLLACYGRAAKSTNA